MFPINAAIADALKPRRKRKHENSGIQVDQPPPSVDKELLCHLKAAVRAEGGHRQQFLLDELRRQLVLELDSPSGASRLQALQLVDVLFLHVPAFRTLICQDLREFVGCAQASVGSAGAGSVAGRGVQRSPPKDFQEQVRAATLRMLEKWDCKHGDSLPPLRAMARYLRESSSLRMPNIAAELRTQEEARREARATTQWCLLAALEVLPRGLSSQPGTEPGLGGDERDTVKGQLREVRECLLQLQECFNVLFPGVGAAARTGGSTSTPAPQQHFVDEDSDDELTKSEGEDEGQPLDEDNDVEWEDFESDGEQVIEQRRSHASVGSAEGGAGVKGEHARHVSGESQGIYLGSDEHGGAKERLLQAARSAMPFALSIDLGGGASSVRDVVSGSGADTVISDVRALERQLRTAVLPRVQKWRALFGGDELFEGLIALLGCAGAADRGRLSTSCGEARLQLQSLFERAEDLSRRCVVFSQSSATLP
eukprot:CAMPEP_0114413272 /NCGR_PEP_ID=MMETSP0103-20121206/767_1 /TAXON_ID=37642 ORGANISM="Paraphysomonas imperforata, Strain PA2" /NCGR_SAMPLE_ID=MMETSP0103 /ASSEMBLY_ACC=CAM_ASM_000201 /LENGTH=481 /DNA_ID=CAMNT_0001581337 /DNA_START=98 /DNA_END=1546 /DNA_ORIENTATION=-